MASSALTNQQSAVNMNVVNYVEKNRNLVENVRQEFLDYYEMNCTSFYDDDIEMVKREDWWTVRFLRVNNEKPDRSLRQMIETFRWRRSYGIRDREPSELPIEFIQIAPIIKLGTDRKGRQVLYVRMKVHRKIPELDIYFRQYLAGGLEQIERLTGSRGYVMVYDFSGSSMSNVDLGLLRFSISLLRQYYPCGVRLSLMCNMPNMFRPVWNASKLMIGDSLKNFHFCSKEQLTDYISEENIPRYLGGKSTYDFTKHVEGVDLSQCKSIRQLATKYGFSDEQVERFLKIFEPSLIEAQQLVKGISYDLADTDLEQICKDK